MKNFPKIAGVAALLCLTALSAKAATLTNWARGGIATQSSTYPGGDASKAIDGNYSGWWTEGSITHTADSENNDTSHPWWQLDLQGAKSISHLHIWFRDDCCQVRNDARVAGSSESKISSSWTVSLTCPFASRPPSGTIEALCPGVSCT